MRLSNGTGTAHGRIESLAGSSNKKAAAPLYKQQLTTAYGEDYVVRDEGENGSQRSQRTGGGAGGRRQRSQSLSSLTSYESDEATSSSSTMPKLAINGLKVPTHEELIEVQRELRMMRKETGERLKMLKKQGLEDGQDLKISVKDGVRKTLLSKAAKDRPSSEAGVPKKATSKGQIKPKKRKLTALESEDDSLSEKDSLKDELGLKPLGSSLGKIKITSKLKDRAQARSSTPQASANHVIKADDFTLPQCYTLPPRPRPMPVMPSPYEQNKVDEDFTKIKAPANQIPISTFYASLEPYFRPITSEDVSWLEARGDEISPFLIPPLGPFYVDTWMEEDRVLAGLPPMLDSPLDGSNGRAQDLDPVPAIDSQLTESDLVMEEKFAGPLSERILSALVTEKVIGPADVLHPTKASPAQSNEDGRAAWVGLGLGSAKAQFEGMDVVEYEDRIKRELRYLGLIPAAEDELDWANRCDDEMSTLLRHCQTLLRTQIRENEFRRARLAEAAKDRMAYQEYQGVVDELDRGVELGFFRRLKAVKKGRKRERKEKAKELKEEGGGGIPADASSALPSLAPTAAETNSIPISAALKDAVERREKFIEMLYPVFREDEHVLPGAYQTDGPSEDPEHARALTHAADQGQEDDKLSTPRPLEPSPKGRFTGTPSYSIYHGLEAWLRERAAQDDVE